VLIYEARGTTIGDFVSVLRRMKAEMGSSEDSMGERNRELFEEEL